jgi:hypothetical protein
MFSTVLSVVLHISQLSTNECSVNDTYIFIFWGGWVFIDIRIVYSCVMNWDILNPLLYLNFSHQLLLFCIVLYCIVLYCIVSPQQHALSGILPNKCCLDLEICMVHNY